MISVYKSTPFGWRISKVRLPLSLLNSVTRLPWPHRLSSRLVHCQIQPQVDKQDGVSIEVPTPSTVPGDTSEAGCVLGCLGFGLFGIWNVLELELYFPVIVLRQATSDASEPTSGSARPKDFEYENAVDDGYYFVGDGPQDDDSCLKTLLEFLVLEKLAIIAKQNGLHYLFWLFPGSSCSWPFRPTGSCAWRGPQNEGRITWHRSGASCRYFGWWMQPSPRLETE